MRAIVVVCAIALAFAALSAVNAQRVLPAGEKVNVIPKTRHQIEADKAKANAKAKPTVKPNAKPTAAKPTAAKPASATQCPAPSSRATHCRGVAKVPAGKWAVSQSAPWASDYLRCLSQCAASDAPAAPVKGAASAATFKAQFRAAYAAVKAAKKTNTKKAAAKPNAANGKAAANANSKKSLLEIKRAHMASRAVTRWDPTKPLQDLLVTVLRGVDLAEQVLSGKGKQIWQALRCPTCQVAVLRLYQKGCGAVANAVCRGVSGVACGSFAPACNAVICPAIDPLFASQCMNVIKSLQTFPEFTASVPYYVCRTINLCFDSDENFGAGM